MNLAVYLSVILYAEYNKRTEDLIVFELYIDMYIRNSSKTNGRCYASHREIEQSLYNNILIFLRRGDAPLYYRVCTFYADKKLQFLQKCSHGLSHIIIYRLIKPNSF